MKARVKKGVSMYMGEVYSDKHNDWVKVTPFCFTKWGAEYELDKWIKRNRPKEFEI